MRDEDIFKRLKKETPLVKQKKDLQPMPHKEDAPKRSSFDLLVEKGNDKREERRGGYQTRSGGYHRTDGRDARKPENPEGPSLYIDAAHTEAERVQRPQPRTIQARSETRIRTNPEPLQRPEKRVAETQPPVRPRQETVSVPPVASHVTPQPPKQQREEPSASTASPQPQVRSREEVESVPRKPVAAPNSQQRGSRELDAPPVKRSSLRDAYTHADDEELEIFSEVRPKRRGTEGADSLAMASMRRDRTGLDEYYELAQASDTEATLRHELKFYINYTDYILLRNTLKALMQLDKYAGENGEYFIRSLYFDDEYETALMDKLGGSDDRSKYRIRIYNFRDDVIKFEKKIKQGQFITKKTVNLSRNDYEDIMAGEYGFLLRRKEPLASELFLQLTNNRLRPRVVVDYIREPYVYPVENIRITFDKELRSGMWQKPDIFDPNLPTMPMYDEGTMVLEVKFEKYLPAHILGVLNNIGAAERSAISKYVICRKFE